MTDRHHNALPITAFVAVVCLLCGFALSDAAQQPKSEDQWLRVLKSNAGWQEKYSACVALRQIGTEKSVPVLAKLLTDEKMAQCARYALEPMPFPSVGKALRVALAESKGPTKVGIINSLGVRRDKEAVPAMASLINDADAAVADAAVAALGRIASNAAVAALLKVADSKKTTVGEALLAAGQVLVKENNRAMAAEVYERILGAPGWPEFVRMGAFYGLAAAQPEKVTERVLAALAGDDPAFRNIAGQIVAETSGAESTIAYTHALAGLPAAGRLVLIRGLAARKDPLARGAVVAAATDSDGAVRVAAVKALAVLGGPAEVPVLAAMLNTDDAEMADAIIATLNTLEGEGVDAAVATAAETAPAPVHARLLEVLGTRRALQSATLAVNGLKNKDTVVRTAALRVLAARGGVDHAQAVIDAIVRPRDPAELPAAEKALVAICSRAGNAVLPAIARAMKKAKPDARVVLLRGAAQVTGPEALKMVLAAMKHRKQPVRDEAARLLSNWTNPEAVPHLLELAKSTDEGRQVLGLRGYVRFAQAEQNPEKKLSMLTEAVALAKRPDEQKLVIAAWGTVHAPQALAVLTPYLRNPEVKNEAAVATVNVAEALLQQADRKPQAVEALKAVVDLVDSGSARQKAEDILRKLQGSNP